MPKNLVLPEDIVGKRFGKLVVQSYLGKQLHGKKTWAYTYDCRCDCGKEHVIAVRSSLIKGDKKSCGCAYQDAGNAIIEDLSGLRFGRWTVLYRAPNRVSKSGKTRSIMWHCRCDCGREKDVGARALKTGMSMSCGCLQKERVSEALTDDLVGRKFAHLTVVSRNGSWYPKNYNGLTIKGGVRAVWHCKCDCGGECDAVGELLKNGDITSCGCSHTSKYEFYVAEYLESCGYKLKVDYFREKIFSGLVGINEGPLRFDFCVNLHHSGESVLIECQGEQHYKSVEMFGDKQYLAYVQEHDRRKREFAERNNIRLILIEYTNVTYESIVSVLKENGVF